MMIEIFNRKKDGYRNLDALVRGSYEYDVLGLLEVTTFVTKRQFGEEIVA